MSLCRFASLSLAALLLVACEPAANQPEQPSSSVSEAFDFLFKQEYVPSIEITVDEGWEQMVKAFLETGSEAYAKGSFALNGEELAPVGVRIKGTVKGGKGREELKYALKLNFNYFGGERFRGIDKLHLENNKPDPSGLREAMALATYRKMGVPCARADFAEVTVDGEVAGVYTMIQDLDKRFLKDWFGSAGHADDGNLYECVPPGCNLLWAGDKKGNYVSGSGDGARGLVLQTNADDPELSNYADLIDLLDILNNSSDEEFEGAFGERFEVDLFLRWLATAVALADYDNYLSSPDNFFLYHRPDTGRFVYIPTDHNKAYGLKSCKLSFEATGGAIDPPWCTVGERPLIDRILAVPAWRELYLDHLEELLDSHFTLDSQVALIEQLNARVGWMIAEDKHSYFTSDDYYDSIIEVAGNEDLGNLRVFVSQRRAFLLEELTAARERR